MLYTCAQSSKFKVKKTLWGFTLAELLISLAILGAIATFTIPKILSTQQDSRNNAIAKEAASMLSGAFQQAQLQNITTTNTTMGNLTPYMNYLRVDAVSTIDLAHTGGSRACTSPYECLDLHNGATILYNPTEQFCGAGNNAIYFYVDPDGKVTDGTTNGPGKSVLMFLYYNGRITTSGGLTPNTQSGPGCSQTYQPDSSIDPPWFNW